MNRSVLARIGPALFAFYVLAYAGFFGWFWLRPPIDQYLPLFGVEVAARRALLELLRWSVPLTAAAVVTALSLAAGSAKHGGPALPFSQIVASTVITFLVLAVNLAPAIRRVVADPLLQLLAPSAAYIVVGVLLLLVDILFVPADRWTVEAGR